MGLFSLKHTRKSWVTCVRTKFIIFTFHFYSFYSSQRILHQNVNVLNQKIIWTTSRLTTSTTATARATITTPKTKPWPKKQYRCNKQQQRRCYLRQSFHHGNNNDVLINNNVDSSNNAYKQLSYCQQHQQRYKQISYRQHQQPT